MQSRIFDMFVQGDQISKADERGFEIGLSLVKRLLEMHGGNIGVHGEGINRGSQFSVRLPIFVDSPKIVTEANRQDDVLKHAGLRILVVLDNEAAAVPDNVTSCSKLADQEEAMSDARDAKLQSAREACRLRRAAT